MRRTISDRLSELNIALPVISEPGANYVQSVQSGNLLFVTGQLPKWSGERQFIGRLGAEFTVEDGQAAARLCALNIIAVVQQALADDLNRFGRCVRMKGYVNATPEFLEFSQVINGASDLMVTVFGDAGRHTRVAVGAALPYGCAVEVEADFELRLCSRTG